MREEFGGAAGGDMSAYHGPYYQPFSRVKQQRYELELHRAANHMRNGICIGVTGPTGPPGVPRSKHWDIFQQAGAPEQGRWGARWCVYPVADEHHSVHGFWFDTEDTARRVHAWKLAWEAQRPWWFVIRAVQLWRWLCSHG